MPDQAEHQHPHILTLIDSGEADGFADFIMSYVKGESLRAKLARERELPVSEAARILRDMVDALAGGERHGVGATHGWWQRVVPSGPR